MGLSNFPSPAEGVLPMLVMNTVLSVALLKNMVRSMLHVVSASGASGASSNLNEDSSHEASENTPRRRRISITRYKSLCKSRFNIARSSSSGIDGGSCSTSSGTCTSDTMWSLMECCVCLCRFKADEEVSELSCKHFFHKACLEKWFDNQHTTCPLCRSIL